MIPSSLRKLNVFIVDDSALMRHSLCSLLRECAEVEIVGEAKDGMEALVSLFRPDIIILDLHMPIMSGLEVLRASQGRYPDSAIVVLTVSAEAEFREECLKLGANHFVVKDAEPAKLMEIIDTLRRHH